MPNISKLNINNNEYVIKDSLAQENISTIVDVIQLNNEGVSLRLNNLNNRLEKIEDEDSKVISSSLNDLNSRINTLENGDFGEDNIIESITVNDTQLTPDTNKNISISIKENVKADWNATSGSDSEILNKPDLANFITSIKTVNNESLVGTGNIVISGLPVVTSADNGKILMVVNGQWQLVSPSVLYSGNGIPNNANGNNGDLYMQTN